MVWVWYGATLRFGYVSALQFWNAGQCGPENCRQPLEPKVGIFRRTPEVMNESLNPNIICFLNLLGLSVHHLGAWEIGYVQSKSTNHTLYINP